MNGLRCWWCGGPANSREHKFKKTELVRTNGPGPWKGDAAVVHGFGDKELRTVQGPNAAAVKFGVSMCQSCNGARSQPFDRAYDKFIGYLADNEASIAENRSFRFSDIYGDNWPIQRLNLIKYWVKHVCCVAVQSGMTIPTALTDYLSSATSGAPAHLRLALVVQADVIRLRLHDGMPHGSFVGDVIGRLDQQGRLEAIESYTMWGWMVVSYVFDLSDDLGATNCEGDLVEMGWISQVSDHYTLDPTDLMASPLMEHRRQQGSPPLWATRP